MPRTKGQRAKAKKNSSTVLYADDFRTLAGECAQTGVTESERLRQIVSAYYANERLKTFGRDSVEAPIKDLQREAVAAELAPIKERVAALARDVQELLGTSGDILAAVSGAAQAEQAGPARATDGGNGAAVSSLESAAAELSRRASEIATCLEEIASHVSAPPAPPDEAVVKELAGIKRMTALLAMRVIKASVYDAARAALGPDRPFEVHWSREGKFVIKSSRRVAAEVTDDAHEITPEDFHRQTRRQARPGETVSVPLPLDQHLAVANATMRGLEELYD